MSEQIFTAEQLTAVRRFAEMVRLRVERQGLVPNTSTFGRRNLGGGQTYQGARDYDTVLGRTAELTFNDYHTMYQRGGLAGTIIDTRAEDTWGEPPTVTEEDDEETEFILQWQALVERLNVWDVLRRADALSGIGDYGVLLFGLAGGEDPAQPVEEGSIQGPEGLLYLRPFHQGAAEIKTYETNRENKRCGYPLLYDVQLERDGGRQVVHHSRILHLAEFRTDSEVIGRPWLQRPYDTLMDMAYKILGGSAEAFWLNQRKATLFTSKEGYDFDVTDDTELAGFKDQLETLVHDLARFLIGPGFEAQEIGGPDIADPSGPFQTHLDVVAAVTRMPKHILMGSAAGELASSESDDRRWAGTIRRRQNTYATGIVRRFIDRLIWFGALVAPTNGYEIGELDDNGNRNWPSIIQMTEEQEANIALRRASALKQFQDPATGAMPATKKEQRVIALLPPEIPDDMKDDEPEQPAQVPGQPEAQPGQPGAEVPEGIPELPGGPEMVEPPTEPDEEAERQRVNELFTGSHVPMIVASICPLCGYDQAEHYEGHGPLLRCSQCKRTYDPTVEGVGSVIYTREEGEHAHS